MESFRSPNGKPVMLRLLLAMLLIVMGCTPAPTSMAGAPGLSATAVPDTPITEQKPTPSPVLAPTSTNFVSKAVIKIATQSPLSGNLGIFGIDIMRGAELAVRQMSGTLAKNGYSLELSSYDDKNNIEAAQANAARIIADPEVLCVVGHYGGRVTLQASELYHSAGLALVSPSAENFALTEAGYLEINRIIGRNDQQGLAGAQFAKEQGFSKVYIVTQKEQYGLRNAENFRSGIDEYGLQVLGMVFLETTDNPDPVVADIVADNPELVYFAATADLAIPFFQKARAAGYTGAFLGLDDLNNPSLFGPEDASLMEGDGLYYTIMNVPAHFYPDIGQFTQDFNIHYGASPLLFAARAYDATGICIRAIENASEEIGGAVPTREQVAKAIRNVQGYKGITGTYDLDDKGDPTLAKYYVYKVVAVDTANWNQNVLIGAYDVATR